MSAVSSRSDASRRTPSSETLLETSSLSHTRQTSGRAARVCRGRREGARRASESPPCDQKRLAFRSRLVTTVRFSIRFGLLRVPTTRAVRGIPEHHRSSKARHLFNHSLKIQRNSRDRQAAAKRCSTCSTRVSLCPSFSLFSLLFFFLFLRVQRADLAVPILCLFLSYAYRTRRSRDVLLSKSVIIISVKVWATGLRRRRLGASLGVYESASPTPRGVRGGVCGLSRLGDACFLECEFGTRRRRPSTKGGVLAISLSLSLSLGETRRSSRSRSQVGRTTRRWRGSPAPRRD